MSVRARLLRHALMLDPVVSVIICTRNRPKQLVRCVASVVKAADRVPELPTEIIVLENNSALDQSLDHSMLRQIDARIHLIKVDKGGLSHARNVGIKAARGRLLVFTDDDCIMDGDHLADMARHAAQQAGPIFIGGRVILADPDDLPFTIKDDPTPSFYNVSIHPGGFIPGCNFVLSREAANVIGNFDTRFGAGAQFRAGEDTDYIVRAHLAGIQIKYVPDMLVLHHHGRQQFSEIKDLSQAYSFANGALYIKHVRELWLLRHLYWSIRAAIKERFGGPAFDKALGLTWSDVARANISGAYAYLVRPMTARRMTPRIKTAK